MNKPQNYRLACTLSYGDIYGQIIIWLAVVFISLAAALAFIGLNRPTYAFMTLGLVLVLSLPFLLFAFVTTLLNHVELREVSSAPEAAPAPEATDPSPSPTPVTS
ncbi:hypothetical protein [Prochlorothrix hollandica]|uniref:Regulator of phycobilisome association C n=1 Tax=Prochlorothrix hollandica PCC 9006 = CALU 1027 TaxID=317619 RepID=A0A0M2PWG4_PROHO|nr:hypothetical protein [Prochlorothrix hollandica]KKI99003.1 hypothetical protein PROH_14410 [Prochlorothrix hollandica PCC 9006 = CALU 1027]